MEMMFTERVQGHTEDLLAVLGCSSLWLKREHISPKAELLQKSENNFEPQFCSSALMIASSIKLNPLRHECIYIKPYHTRNHTIYSARVYFLYMNKPSVKTLQLNALKPSI